MALPLTNFKTIPYTPTGTLTEVYTTPIGYNAIVLTAQAVNKGIANEPLTIELSGTRNGTPFTQTIVYEYEIPPNEVLVAIGGSAGKLVLQTGDILSVSGGTDLNFTLSVLETLV